MRKLSDVIAQLQAELEKHGDIPCFTNGEHGAEETEILTQSNVQVGQACITIADEYVECAVECGALQSPDQIVCNIGGY